MLNVCVLCLNRGKSPQIFFHLFVVAIGKKNNTINKSSFFSPKEVEISVMTLVGVGVGVLYFSLCKLSRQEHVFILCSVKAVFGVHQHFSNCSSYFIV